MKIKLIFALIIIGVLMTLIFFSSNDKTHEEFYNEAVQRVFDESYQGEVIDKFHDKDNHGRNKIVLDNNGLKREFDFVYEKSDPYDLIQVGDTLIKQKKSLNLHIKRKSFDTIIQFKFENIKGYEKYRSPHEIVNNLK